MSEEVVDMVERVGVSVARVYVQKPDGRGGTEMGHGSGFLLSADEDGSALVVTNAHVVGIEAGSHHALGFGVRGDLVEEVELVGWHPWVDIAVLRASLDPAPQPLRFREDPARMGEDCVVLGFPWRVDLSVSRGIVSGLDRDTELGPALFPLRWLQSDVMINEGNSGGPIVDLEGSVIGVAAQGLGDRKAEKVEYQDREAELVIRKVRAAGINLFVPADLASAAVEGILSADRDGIPVGDEGIDFDRDFWYEFVQEGNLPTLRDRPGLVAVKVEEGSPAHEAGIEVEDSIVRIDDIEIDHPADLYAWRLRRNSWTTESTVTVWRNGDEFTVPLRAKESRVDPSEYVKRMLGR